ncbi:MAG: hypothetical protein U0326_07275 [Polyangiales bacterium]
MLDPKRGVGTLLELLFPERPAEDLTRLPPDKRRYHDRVQQVERDLKEAHDDAGEEFPLKKVEDAKKNFEKQRGEVRKRGGAEHEAAVAQLVERQAALLLAEVRKHALPGSTVLYASDLLKIEAHARTLGFSPELAVDLARDNGFTPLVTEARAWRSCSMLPGDPTTLAAAAESLLSHEGEASKALRGGAVSAWLDSNESPELADVVAAHERSLADTGKDSLARHRVAWALGLRELRTASLRARSPEELGRRWQGGDVDDAAVVQCAREGVLAPWFAMHDALVLEARAQYLAAHPHDAMALAQLRWAMGIAWELGGEGFTDVRALADRVRTSPAVAQAALRAVADGTFAAWLESLPVGRGDPTWRSALADPWFQSQGSLCGFWAGVYRNAHDRALTLAQHDALETLTTWRPLVQRGFAARFWDLLKTLRASGELVAFVLHADDNHRDLSLALERGIFVLHTPEESEGGNVIVHTQAVPRVRKGEVADVGLNELLWCIGHRGVVLEAGERDRAFDTPADVVSFYESGGWEALEVQLPRGYLLPWLRTFHGVSSGAQHGALVERCADFVQSRLAATMPRGHLSLAFALTCGMQTLPFRPDAPDERQSYRALTLTPGGAEVWEPLVKHAQQGTAVLWALQQPGAPVDALFDLLARIARGPIDASEVIGRLATLVGDPVATPGWVPPATRRSALASQQGGARVTTLPAEAEAHASPVRRVLMIVAAIAAVLVVTNAALSKRSVSGAAPARAAPAALVCPTGVGDCDGFRGNGCETSLSTSALHCGACDRACVAGEHQSIACVAGSCVARCDEGHANCDDDDGNGCEVRIDADPTHCGRCDVSCPAPEGWAATCASSVCGVVCPTGTADCDGRAQDGCEVRVTDDARNCGACGLRCEGGGAHTVSVCEAGHCVTGRCAEGYHDIDRRAENGCEYRCRPTEGVDLPGDRRDNDCDGFDGALGDAVFVSEAGSDGAAGTSEAPLRSVTAAIAKASRDGRHWVYVAAGVYTGTVQLADGVSIVGGFTQGFPWTRRGRGATTLLANQVLDDAVTVVVGRDLQTPTRLVGLTLRTASGPQANDGHGLGTYGVRCENCRALELVDDVFDVANAGSGRDGADGVTGQSGYSGRAGEAARVVTKTLGRWGGWWPLDVRPPGGGRGRGGADGRAGEPGESSDRDARVRR